MDRIKTKIIIAVTGRLSGAKDSDAKTDLIEELSDNLYQRYTDFLASGMSEDEAYERALDDLGDVSELLNYLEEMDERDGNADDLRSREFLNGFIRGVEDVLRETIHYTKDAVDYAKEKTHDLKDKMHEKYPDGVHVNCGYDRERGFYWESNECESKGGTYAAFSAEEVRAVDVQLQAGDATVRVAEGEQVEVIGESDELEVRLHDGVLSVRQGKTASSFVMFGLGLSKADVELKLPAKVWDSVRINTTNGDIDLKTMLRSGEIELSSASGDISADCACAERISMKSASGDINAVELEGGVQAESISGDVTVRGVLTKVHATSVSGDVDVDTAVLPGELTVRSTSGDCAVRLPEGEGFTVELSTTTGDLITDFELLGRVGRKSGSATYLDGGSRNFSITSTSGDIALKKK